MNLVLRKLLKFSTLRKFIKFTTLIFKIYFFFCVLLKLNAILLVSKDKNKTSTYKKVG